MSRDDINRSSVIIAIDPGLTTGVVEMPNGLATTWQVCTAPVTQVMELTPADARLWAMGFSPGSRGLDLSRGMNGDRHILLEDFSMPATSEDERQTLRQIGALDHILTMRGLTVHRIPRSTIKRWLGVAGRTTRGEPITADARVRKALRNIYGSDSFKSCQCPRRRNKGHTDACRLCQGSNFSYLGSLSSLNAKPHAVQALGMAVAWLRRPGLCPCPGCELDRLLLADVVRKIVGDADKGASKAHMLRKMTDAGLDLTMTRLEKLLGARDSGVEKRGMRYFLKGGDA